MMLDVAVIDDPAVAEASLDPTRARLLAELAEPASATMLAARLGLARQKVNYHLRALERHGLVELVAERRKGNVTERLGRATAAAYVISPAALAAVAPDPANAPDRLSARWLLALAAQLVRDVGDLITGAPGQASPWPPSPSTPPSASPRRPTAPPSPTSSPAPSPRWSAGTTTRPPRAPATTASSSPSTPASRPSRARRRSPSDAARIRGPQRDRAGRHPRAGLGGDRLRPGHRLLVHGTQPGRAP